MEGGLCRGSVYSMSQLLYSIGEWAAAMFFSRVSLRQGGRFRCAARNDPLIPELVFFCVLYSFLSRRTV